MKQKHKLLLDSLTQVFNRAAFDERVELEYKRWQRYQNPLCLAIVDIDHFKSINDRFGHLSGDDALLLISAAIRRSVRNQDEVGRIGGEEFGVYLRGASRADADQIGERLRQEVENLSERFGVGDRKEDQTLEVFDGPVVGGQIRKVKSCTCHN